MDDHYDLQRFVEAQNPEYEQVCAELRSGEKRGHWMWFVFPQLRGLGYSLMATKFGISSREEADAYLRHPVLGPRLTDCTTLVNRITDRSITQIFGYPDDLKFRSSMSLFARVTSGNTVFQEALQKFFGGEPDALTLKKLGG